MVRTLLHTVLCCIVIAGTPAAFAQSQGKPINVFEHPRYKENPVYLFFEHYILDVVGELSSEKSKLIQNMNLQKVFKTKATEWHDVLKEALGLSPTINIAIKKLQSFKASNIRHSNMQ